MGERAAWRSRQARPSCVPEETDPRDLVRLLLTKARGCHAPGHREDPEFEEIMIDIEVDGLRYLLVRLPVPDRTQFVLSPRELEIAQMVARGLQNKTIADVLSISSWTVCTHMRRIFAKLGVNSRAAMVAKLRHIEVGRERSGDASGSRVGPVA